MTPGLDSQGVNKSWILNFNVLPPVYTETFSRIIQLISVQHKSLRCSHEWTIDSSVQQWINDISAPEVTPSVVANNDIADRH